LKIRNCPSPLKSAGKGGKKARITLDQKKGVKKKEEGVYPRKKKKGGARRRKSNKKLPGREGLNCGKKSTRAFLDE